MSRLDHLSLEARSKKFGAAEADGIVRCDACPVLCRIRPGRAGACARYANERRHARAHRSGRAHAAHARSNSGKLVAVRQQCAWDGAPLDPARTFVTGVGAGTTYPDYKPAPFIVSAEHAGVDTVTVVTEGIFSYCGVKVKIDTDRHLGPETAADPRQGRAGRPRHDRRVRLADALDRRRAPPDRRLQEGRQRHLRRPARALRRRARRDDASTAATPWSSQAGKAPIVDGRPEVRMRVGCGSATVGIFARQWLGHVDEVIVVDDHITGVLTEHQSGRVLDMPPGRHPRARAQIHAGALLPGRQSGPRLGRHRHHRPAGDHPEDRRQGRLARPAAADDLDHRRGCALLRARRPACSPVPARHAGAGARRRRAHRRELRAVAVHACCSWPAPADRCAPASPRTRCC